MDVKSKAKRVKEKFKDNGILMLCMVMDAKLVLTAMLLVNDFSVM